MQALLIPPVLGAVCEEQAVINGCMHGSCQEIECNGCIVFAEGPLCAHADYWGDCTHESCMQINPPQAFCPKPGHGWQIITSAGVSTGFAGGRVYWANLGCGCCDIDESDDVRAAY